MYFQSHKKYYEDFNVSEKRPSEKAQKKWRLFENDVKKMIFSWLANNFSFSFYGSVGSNRLSQCFVEKQTMLEVMIV